MALHLARRKHRLHYNPSLIHLFSTSSSSPQDGNESGEHPSQPPSSSSSSPSDFKTASYFSGLKSSLKQNPQREDGKRHFARFDANAQNPAPSLFSNQFGGQIQDIRRNLNEFRSRAAAPPPRDWQDLYKQDVLSKSGDSHGNRKLEAEPYANIKQNLRQMRPQANTESKWANLSGLKTKFNEKHRSNLFGGGGGGEELPISVFGKELEEGKKNENESEEMKSELIRSYDTDELGEKLRMYRPQGKKEEGWFSLQELNQRLVKLRVMEDEREQSTMINQPSIVKELRSELRKVKADEGNKVSKFDVWGILNGTPKYLLEPPKDQLVETYFHPDNMSSAEKMKTELAKVRDEFKMSESDCGSARVQVAQLTTKIKHLSSVLHKKDKHSRKGLIAMVQRRKKLLKYMRRTDWDSYCLSLAKLGLRDNPDYKF